MSRPAILIAVVALCAAFAPAANAHAGDKGGTDVTQRWPAKKARDWYARQPWLVGCNYVPSSAVNDVEMWQEQTFDPQRIDRELGWAAGVGMNTVRVFLNYVVWRAGPEGFKKRLSQFLDIAAKHRITVMPVLLDDCAFAGKEPRVGPQDDPVPGVHNSGWVPSPGLKLVADRSAWGDLERYVKDTVAAFARDGRVVAWDLYNEPGNSGMGDKSLPLMEAAFAWARQASPSQPLTVAAWADFRSPMQRRMLELSDVVSFHGYDALPGIRAKLAICKEQARPVLCTEWLRRQAGNTFRTILPLFRQERIGCYNWGLVAGKTQTYLHWGSRKGSPTPAVWQHDLLHKDGRPWRPSEIEFLKTMVARPEAESRPAE